MARRRRRTATAARIVRVPTRTAAPIIKVSAPRAAPARRRRRRRSYSRGGRIGGLVSNSAIAEGMGGLAYGFAVKQGWIEKLPAIPIIGRTGTAALLLHFWAQRGGGEIVRRAATAAAVLAGYQLGSTGAITGDNDLVTMGGSYAEPYYAEGGEEEEVEEELAD